MPNETRVRCRLSNVLGFFPAAIDPPNGRLPPVTPEIQKLAASERAFRVALLQSTETCKNKEPACNGGKYDPAQSPRFAELPPRYNTARMNRHYGPGTPRWQSAA